MFSLIPGVRREVRRRRGRDPLLGRHDRREEPLQRARNPLAQFRRDSAEQICQMAAVAGRLSVFDCAGVADGALAVIMCRAEDAHKYTDNALYVKALSFVAAPVPVRSTPTTTTRPCPSASGRPTTPTPRPASRHRVTRSPSPSPRLLHADRTRIDGGPRVLRPGQAWRRLDGAFRLDGRLPVNSDGGLKAFGHPVGASGPAHALRDLAQLRGEAPEERRIADHGRKLGLVHNLGGYPGRW